MSLTPAMIDALVASGATAEMLAAVMKASLADDEAKANERRAKDAERQRQHRQRNAVSRNVTVTDCDRCDAPLSPSSSPLFPPLSPAPLSPPIIPPPSPPIPDISRAKPKADDAGFTQFWETYPRRTGKEAARKAWCKAKQRGATCQAMIEAARKFAEHPPDDAQFIPHPATWLNQGRYDDEPMETRNGNGHMANGRTQHRASASLDWIERNLGGGGGAFEADEGPQGMHRGARLALPGSA
jgi:hypothetical protein